MLRNGLQLATIIRYFDNIVYRDNLSNIAIRYFLLAIAITATEIMC